MNTEYSLKIYVKVIIFCNTNKLQTNLNKLNEKALAYTKYSFVNNAFNKDLSVKKHCCNLYC